MWKDSETELDFLDYDYLVQSIISIIMNDKLLPASIGVYGDWGSGKSSLMHMCKSRLIKEDESIKCLTFNGWLFEDYADAKTAIIGSILDAIESETKLTDKAKTVLKSLYDSVDKLQLAKNIGQAGLSFLLTGGFDLFAGLTVKKVFNAAKAKMKGAAEELDLSAIDTTDVEQAIKDNLNHKELRTNVREFQKQFSELLEESKISRLVIFIDELDRCRPDTILDTLEAMKLFIFTGKVAVIIGADERHISYAVKSKFSAIEGIQIDIGKEYLEKLIQYPVRIPRLNASEVEVYIACLLMQDELSEATFTKWLNALQQARQDDFASINIAQITNGISLSEAEKSKCAECHIVAQQLSSVLSRGLHGNPRQCKRFLNELDMRLKMAAYKHKALDRKVLAKIMMLEYIMPALFKKIADMAVNNQLKEELSTFEQDNLSEADIESLNVDQLGAWKKDPWFISWCSIQPKLADEDLRLYLYFTRTSLDEKISRISTRLSPDAQNVLEKLLSKSDSQLQSALDSAKDLSEAELKTIMNIIGEQIRSESKPDQNLIRALTALAEVRASLFSEAFAHIQSFTGSQIPTAATPHIGQLAKVANMKKEYKDLAEKWKPDNPIAAQALINYINTDI